jgi:ATP-dependent RNA helicase DeaD
VDRRCKIELLTRLIDIHDFKLGIIFCNTKRMVDDLVDHLEAQGYMADRLHGDMTQNMRDRVMNKFRKSGLEFLVATDVAARGIDVDDVQVVFNYDLPYDSEDYVHRIGRTGRKGLSGRAISFVSGRELFQIRNIERYANTRIHRARIPTEAEVVEARESAFVDKLRALLKSGEFKRQDQLIERLLEEGFTSTDIASACLAQLQSGEAAPAPTPRPAEYDHPERPGRECFRDGPRGRPDDRRAPRWEHDSPEPQRPRPFVRAAAGDSCAPGKPPRPIGALVSDPARPSKVEPPRHLEKPIAPTPEIIPSTSQISAESPSAPRRSRGNETQTGKKLETPHVVSSKPEAEKTYSDEEILASVKPEPRQPAELRPPGKSTPPWVRQKHSEEKAVRPPKKSRPPAGNYTRLHMNLGEAMGVVPIDIVNAIAGETGLPGKVVGTVDIRERHLFVDVASDHANAILAKLNRTQIKGHKVKIKAA